MTAKHKLYKYVGADKGLFEVSAKLHKINSNSNFGCDRLKELWKRYFQAAEHSEDRRTRERNKNVAVISNQRFKLQQ